MRLQFETFVVRAERKRRGSLESDHFDGLTIDACLQNDEKNFGQN